MSGNLNKGEWSEFFATAKAIVTGRVRRWASQLWRQIACVVVDKTSYWPLGDGKVRIDWPNKPSETVIVTYWSVLLSTAWQEVLDGHGRSFPCPTLQRLAAALRIEKLKSASNNKDDLTIQFADSDVKLGYSVKSAIAARSACLNASRATTMIYEITGVAETNDELNWMDRHEGLKVMIQRIGFNNIKFKSVRDDEWRNSLGEDQAKILAELVKKYYTSTGSNFRAYIEALKEEKRLGGRQVRHVEGTMRHFLYDSVYNNSPQREAIQASGGLLLVQKDGELVCLPWQEAKESHDYLLKNAQLDTPSQTRHDFGFVYSRGEFPSGTFLRNLSRNETPRTKPRTKPGTKELIADEKAERQRRKRLCNYRKEAKSKDSFTVITADLAWLSCQDLSDVTDETLTLQRRKSFEEHWEDLWVCEQIVNPRVRYLNLVVGVRLKNQSDTVDTIKEAANGNGK